MRTGSELMTPTLAPYPRVRRRFFTESASTLDAVHAAAERRPHTSRLPLEETSVQTWPGTAYPLGATFDGSGTNFALYSEVADRVELCLFDEDGTETRVDLIDVDAYVWHGYL